MTQRENIRNTIRHRTITLVWNKAINEGRKHIKEELWNDVNEALMVPVRDDARINVLELSKVALYQNSNKQ